METLLGLEKIKTGEIAIVRELKNGGDIRRRLRDVGLIENTTVECVGKSPGGDPSAYLIRGAVIAIRAEDARYIKVTLCPKGE